MSEVVEGAAVTATAGALLREAREASGMHIAALAVALKVPVGKLEALEADNYAALPDTVFVRALASSVCRTLKVDPAHILSLLPQSQSPRLSTDSAGLNAPVKANVGKSSSSSASFSSGSGTRSRSVSLVVLALLVGAVVVFFLPRQPGGLSLLSSGPAAQSSDTVSGAAQPAAAGASASVVENVAVDTASPAVAPAPLPAPLAPSQTAAVQPAAPTAAATGAAPPATATATAAAPVATASDPAAGPAAAGTLVLRARNQSWVQVKDASGAVVLQRNLAAEESVAVNAPAPLAVVVGRADATEVFVRGKPFDLTGVSRENVARFEVK